MLDNPRPSPRYWKLMLYYSVSVFFVKYSLQLTMLELLVTKYFSFSLHEYKDPYKVGFSLCRLTYSETLFYYTIWDVLCICGIICHEYILLKSGLSEKSEYDTETLHNAKVRLGLIQEERGPAVPLLLELPREEEEEKGAASLSFQEVPEYQGGEGPVERAVSENFSLENEASLLMLSMEEEKKSEGRVKRFFRRLLPFDSEEKPGHDLYTYTIIMQMLILLCIILLYTHMDGESQDISLAIK